MNFSKCCRIQKNLRKFPLYFNCESHGLSSVVLVAIASSKTSGGTSPVGLTTESSSWVDIRERRTVAKTEFISSVFTELAATHFSMDLKIATSGAQKESLDIISLTLVDESLKKESLTIQIEIFKLLKKHYSHGKYIITCDKTIEAWLSI